MSENPASKTQLSGPDVALKEHFQRVNEVVDATVPEVKRLNEGYDVAGTLPTPELADPAREIIGQKLGEVMRPLIETGQDPTPYDLVVEREAELAGKLPSAEKTRDQIEARIAERRKVLLDEASAVTSLVPEATETLHEEVERLLVSESDAIRQEVEAEAARIAGEYNLFVNEVYTEAGKPWPVPRVAPELPKSEELLEPGTVNIDAFEVPLEARAAAERAETVDEVRRKYPEEVLHNASEFIALILAEKPGQVFSGHQLGEILYPDEAIQVRSARIAALISKYRHGKVGIIGEILAAQEVPLRFERGLRTAHDINTGEKVGLSYPVYRAVPVAKHGDGEYDVGPSEFSMSDRTVKTGDWAPLNDQVEEISVASAEDPVVEPGQPVIKEESQIPSDAAPVEAPEPIATEEVQVEPPEPSPPEDEQNLPEELKDYQVDFIQRLEQLLEEYEKLGLLKPKGTLDRKTLQAKRPSRRVGTDEMINRGVAANIINRFRSKRIDPDLELPIFRWMTMELQNQFATSVFNNQQKTKWALGYAEERVSSRLRELERESRRTS